MLDDKARADLDQCRAEVIESFPPLIAGLFHGFIHEGFTTDQAFELCKTYLNAMVQDHKG